MSNIVQYVVVRKDLAWPTGALIAQGAHASVAAIAKWYDRPETKQYLDKLEEMHKVVLAAQDESQLRELATKLEDAGIEHFAWREQPENEITAVASAPHLKERLAPYFKAFKLYK